MKLHRALAEHTLRHHPAEAARVLETLPPAICAQVLERLDAAATGEILKALAPHAAALVLQGISSGLRAEALASMPAPVAAHLLRRLGEAGARIISDELPKQTARRLLPLLRPREATAGALADPDVLVLPAEARIKEVLKTQRDALIKALHDVPVVDGEHRLVGIVSPDQLLLPRRDATVAKIMKPNPAHLMSSASLAQIAAAPAWRTTHALPVTDPQGAFIGLLRYETFRWVEQQLPRNMPLGQPSTSAALGDLFATAMGGMFEAVIAATKDEGQHER